MVTAFDKAIVAVLVPLIVAFAASQGIKIDGEALGVPLEGIVLAILTALSVYFVPNKSAS